MTESILIEDFKRVIELLTRLREIGFRVSLDDFGTGYSSLLAVRNLPIDELKIDKAFVQEISENKDDQVLIRQILSIAHSRGLRVVAEGVETESESIFLRSIHCDTLQGFLFSKPVKLIDVTNFIEGYEPKELFKTTRNQFNNIRKIEDHK